MSQDTVIEDINKIIERKIKSYKLNDREAEEFKIATINYDYEANEGMIITHRDNIVGLYTKEDNQTRIEPTHAQIQAITEFIKETERYYTFKAFYPETDDVLMSILNEKPEKKNKNIERGR